MLSEHTELEDVDSLCMFLLCPLSCGLDLQCRARGMMYDAYKSEHWEEKGGVRWKTPHAYKPNTQVY